MPRCLLLLALETSIDTELLLIGLLVLRGRGAMIREAALS
jgi:hypothetical protein